MTVLYVCRRTFTGEAAKNQNFRPRIATQAIAAMETTRHLTRSEEPRDGRSRDMNHTTKSIDDHTAQGRVGSGGNVDAALAQ